MAKDPHTMTPNTDILAGVLSSKMSAAIWLRVFTKLGVPEGDHGALLRQIAGGGLWSNLLSDKLENLGVMKARVEARASLLEVVARAQQQHKRGLPACAVLLGNYNDYLAQAGMRPELLIGIATVSFFTKARCAYVKSKDVPKHEDRVRMTLAPPLN